MRRWIAPLLVGIAGFGLAFLAWQAWVVYTQHSALWGWAQRTEQRLQLLERGPLDKTAPPRETK